MEETKNVTPQQEQSNQAASENEPAIRPAVDIFEDDSGITLQADMPGVSRERLEVHVDSDSLSIEGAVELPMPGQMEALYADVRSTRYQRSFSLSSELDGSRIDASLRDGVLTLRIPKHERHQPRKIEVRTE